MRLRLGIGLGEFLLVTTISVLIFYLAFSQTKKDVELNVEVLFRVPEGRGGDLTILRPTTLTSVKIVAEGSAVARKDVEAIDRTTLTLVVGNTGIPIDIGDSTVDIQAALQELLQTRRIDATIKSVTPAFVPIRLDALATRQVPVTAQLPGVRVDGRAVTEPPSVTITGPASLLEQAGDIRVEAPLEEATLRALDTGRRHSPTARIRLVPEILGADLSRVTAEPEMVNVVFTLAARDRTLTIGTQESSIPAVEVHVAMSPSDVDRFEIEVAERDRLLREIQLIGPADQIDLVDRRATLVYAYVQLATDDLELALVGGLESAEIVRPVTLWSLPPNVRVVNPGSTDAQIEARRIGDPPSAGVRIMVRRRSESGTQ